ncbi:related to stilbene synthase 2 [Ramularia collo-cygni]|uniref:Related to stilbene synthase 2 n=1 Tax=Ramularia collo-cygni TaxID=112498 RepID=A0A2D3V4H2_9PEZI|nr:related to stilbene synthase 2 [Ramularia collo-cygni]CZT16389.1 related to stilbene synthase 2 [Ramularia collo-cygni]
MATQTNQSKTNPTHHTPPRLWITGLASQFPPYTLTPSDFENIARKFYDVSSPGISKLLRINLSTEIQTRSSINPYSSPGSFGTHPTPPTITHQDEFFRTHGVSLTLQAAQAALLESTLQSHEITHTIAVTCTNQGNPGYDVLVNRALGLRESVDRMLLHGVGCAGGLAILRAAAQVAAGAEARGRPARVLGFACELCTLGVRSELAAAAAVEKIGGEEEVGVAGVLFSDGAAAFVLCNGIGMGEGITPLFELVEWGNSIIPDTVDRMSFYADPYGNRTVLARDVPNLVKQAVEPMFDSIVPDYSAHFSNGLMRKSDFDWALHPGGKAIIEGVKKMLDLSEHQLRATREIYRTKGNSSSPAVLMVLDQLRLMGRGSDHVVATSFGPGLAIEMALLRRCRESETPGSELDAAF